jgi:hypothetical protein
MEVGVLGLVGSKSFEWSHDLLESVVQYGTTLVEHNYLGKL